MKINKKTHYKSIITRFLDNFTTESLEQSLEKSEFKEKFKIHFYSFGYFHGRPNSLGKIEVYWVANF